MKKQPDISELAEKWLKGTITEAEKQIFEDWYNSQPGNNLHWLKNDSEEEVKQNIFQSIMNRLEAEQPVVRRISWKRRLTAAAAILAVVGGAAFYLFSRNSDDNTGNQTAGIVTATSGNTHSATLTLSNGKIIPINSISEGLLAREGEAAVRKTADGQIVYDQQDATGTDQYHTLTVPRGGQIVTVVLADGSRVWLNAESSLRYPVAFANSRQVTVTGEGYFEITKDARKQFAVTAAGVTTQVLGTRFNVNAYQPQQDVWVTLLDGAVKISNASATQQLRPGQQMAADAKGPLHLIESPDLDAVMAWKNSLVKLNNSDIYTVMSQLARWYDVDVQIAQGMGGQRFSGLISRNTHIDTVLNMLSMTQEVSFKRQGNTIIVSPYQ